MTSRELLDLEVSLLLIRYGRKSLLQAIARRSHVDDETLNKEFDNLLNSKLHLTIKNKSKPKVFDLNKILLGKEEKSPYLHKLLTQFENKIFLPELKDIKRFFIRHEKESPKSRALAKLPLFLLLVELEIPELKKLIDQSTANGENSALGLISDEILGRNKSNKNT